MSKRILGGSAISLAESVGNILKSHTQKAQLKAHQEKVRTEAVSKFKRLVNMERAALRFHQRDDDVEPPIAAAESATELPADFTSVVGDFLVKTAALPNVKENLLVKRNIRELQKKGRPQTSMSRRGLSMDAPNPKSYQELFLQQRK